MEGLCTNNPDDNEYFLQSAPERRQTVRSTKCIEDAFRNLLRAYYLRPLRYSSRSRQSPNLSPLSYYTFSPYAHTACYEVWRRVAGDMTVLL